MSGGSSLPDPAPRPRPVRLPVYDNSAINSTRRRAARNTQSRQGRSSTILSDALRNITGSEGLLGR